MTNLTNDQFRSYIRSRVEMFLGEANATEGLPDADPGTIDGVTHALFVAADGDIDTITGDAVYLAALAFEYGKKYGRSGAGHPEVHVDADETTITAITSSLVDGTPGSLPRAMAWASWGTSRPTTPDGPTIWSAGGDTSCCGSAP